MKADASTSINPKRSPLATSVEDWRTRNPQTLTGRYVQWPTWNYKTKFISTLNRYGLHTIEKLTDRRASVGLAHRWTRVENGPDHDQNLDEGHRAEPLVSFPAAMHTINTRLGIELNSLSDENKFTISQSTDLKNGWWIMSTNPVSFRQPKRSAGFLFRNPFKTEEALTDNDLGMRIVFSRMTTRARNENKGIFL